jgi:hypothetical protein
MRVMSRRQLLISGAVVGGAAAVLAACGGGDDEGGNAEPESTDAGAAPDDDLSGFSVIRRIPAEGVLVPGSVRVPVGIAVDGTVQDTGPSTLRATLRDLNRQRQTEVDAVLRNSGLSTAYWAFRVELSDTGVYELVVENSDQAEVTFAVADPSLVVIPYVGSTLEPFDTPTFDDNRGVDPLCSRSGEPCPFHEVTLTEALATGKPVIYMIGTPAHCQTGVCAPGLEALMATAERIGDAAVIVHADVFTDDTATVVTPAVEATRLSYEPVLFFVDPSGTVVDRLDAIWDQSELDETVDRFLA